MQLVRTAHISLGGISIDRTDKAHPYNAMIAEQAAQVIGLQVAGIDLISTDIAQSARETGGAICEVNAGPGLGLHIEPVEGKPRDVARPVVELLFRPGATSRVPIVAVTGTEGRTSTSRMIAHILGSAGRKVGLANSDGMYLGGAHLIQGEMNGPDSARTVLQNPAIETAVLETGYEGILCSGLGYDSADVVVITQISDRHCVVLRQGSGGGLHLFDGRRSTLMFNEDIPARVDERDRSSPAERLAAAAACAGLGIDSTSVGLGLPSFGRE